VVCDPARITLTHIEGALEVVIEILSPATAVKDLQQKNQRDRMTTATDRFEPQWRVGRKG